MEERIKLAQKFIKKAGKIILGKMHQTTYKYKGKNNIVTDVDFESEEVIISSIKKFYPHDDILSEETQNKKVIKKGNTWIIDPLDGTNNYARKIPHSCISVAFCNNGKLEFGLIFDPFRNELFSAIKDKGAFLNDNRISCSNIKSLKKSIIATGFYYDRGKIMEKTLFSINKLFKANICGMRRMGSAALDLAWVALGRYEGYFEYKLNPWDFAAGILIVKEAGGKITDINGKSNGVFSKGIIAGNRYIFNNLKKEVAISL